MGDSVRWTATFAGGYINDCMWASFPCGIVEGAEITVNFRSTAPGGSSVMGPSEVREGSFKTTVTSIEYDGFYLGQFCYSKDGEPGFIRYDECSRHETSNYKRA